MAGGCWGYWRVDGRRMWPAGSMAGDWRKPVDVAGGHWGRRWVEGRRMWPVIATTIYPWVMIGHRWIGG